MKINKDYPTPTELKKIELKTLRYMKSNINANSEFKLFVSAANQTYDSLKDSNRLKNLPFDFEAGFDISL